MKIHTGKIVSLGDPIPWFPLLRHYSSEDA